jgi:hypothetical protein
MPFLTPPPPPQVNGVLELFRLIDAGVYGYAHDDFADITGKAPTGIQQYVTAVAKHGFA